MSVNWTEAAVRTSRTRQHERHDHALSRVRHHLHSAPLDCLGGAQGGEERNQSFGVIDLYRTGHDGGREHLEELDIRREASRVIYALCRQYLANRQDRNAGATFDNHSCRTGPARRDLDVNLARDAKARKEILRQPDAARAACRDLITGLSPQPRQITRLNQIRKSNRELQSRGGLTFRPAHVYGRGLPERGELVLVAVTLDPFRPHDVTACHRWFSAG
jgi:hypothetical protein